MKWYLVIIGVFLGFNVWADSLTLSHFPQPLLLDVQTEQASLSAYCGVLMEEGEELTVEDLKVRDKSHFLPITKKFYHRGYFKEKKPLWFTFQLKNTSAEPLSYFFEIPYPNIDQLQLFEERDSVLITRMLTGTSKPFQEREVPYRYFIYELKLPPQSLTAYYLRVEKDNDELFLPFRLTVPKVHAHEATQLVLVDGLFYGFWGTIFLVAIAAAVWMKTRIYVLYSIMMGTTLLFHLGDSGLGFELVWSESVWFQLRARSLASFISQGAFMLFIIYFFNTNFKRYPVFHPLAWLVTWVYGLLTIHALFFKEASFLPSTDFFVKTFIINILLLIIVGFAIIIKAAMLKHRGALWFLGAFIFPVAGCFVLALRNAGVLPSTFFVDNFFKFGHFLMFMILSIVLVKRMRNINEERIELLGKQAEHQKELMAASLVAMDKERKRIANDLHDGLGALLVSVKHHFASVAKLFEGDNEQEYQKIQQMLEQTYMKTRKITHSMKPPQLEKFGLVPVLEDYCSMIDTDDMSVHLWINGLENNRLSYSEEHNIFRIIQELATNAIKYAKASELVINISREHEMVSITVEDDGIGFDKDDPEFREGLGLRNIQSRVKTLNGTMDFQAGLGEGISVFIEFTAASINAEKNKEAYVKSED